MTKEQFEALPAEAQATIRAGLLFQAMLADKDTGEQARILAEASAKKANPAYRTTEELAAPFVAKALAEVDKRLKERDDKSAQQQAETELANQIASAKRDHGYTDEGIARILKRMQDRKVGDFDTAMKADLVDNPAQNVAPAPGSADRTDWDFYGRGGIESATEKDFFSGKLAEAPSLMENDDAWARSTALAYLNGRITLPNT